MNSYFIQRKDPININIATLKPGWIKAQFGLKGDSVVSGVGTINLPDTHVLADEFNKEEMLFVAFEHSKVSLKEASVRFRLILAMMTHMLGDEFEWSNDKIFYHNLQLSIGFTVTVFRRALVFIGLFIEPREDSVAHVVGLNQFDVSPKNFACRIMQNYCDECLHL